MSKRDAFGLPIKSYDFLRDESDGEIFAVNPFLPLESFQLWEEIHPSTDHSGSESATDVESLNAHDNSNAPRRYRGRISKSNPSVIRNSNHMQSTTFELSIGEELREETKDRINFSSKFRKADEKLKRRGFGNNVVSINTDAKNKVIRFLNSNRVFGYP